MNIKLIAIGSRIMGDDGAGIIIAERLCDEFEAKGIQVIIGETDVEYCLGNINEGDSVIILDSAISGRIVGTVWQLPLNDALNNCNRSQFQHDVDLLSILKMREIQLTGLLICIEVADIRQGWGLSETLQKQLPSICQRVKKIILKYREDIKHA